MSELVRSITARLRQYFRDRRGAKRYPARLSCHVEFAKSGVTANGSQRRPSIVGHTHDISADGMALVLPAIRIGEHYLAGEDRQLRVRLELPGEIIEILAVAVRYDRLAEDEQGTGYVLGASITMMAENDRAHYLEFLTTLSQK